MRHVDAGWPGPWPKITLAFALKHEHWLCLQRYQQRKPVDGAVDERMLRNIFQGQPRMVELATEQEDFENGKSKVVLYARATKHGLRSARNFFSHKPYRVFPRTKDAGDLRRNYNKFVKEETEWEPCPSNVAFKRLCSISPMFKERWAPNLVL